jgi:hypothetical protein
MQWYYSKNGTQLGPITGDELRAKIGSGEISPADLVWKEGMSDWLPSARVPELAPSSAIPSAVSSIPAASGNGEASPYAAPVNAGYPVQPQMVVPSSGKATASMVLGIVGLVFGICGCYGFVIALPCCILAIVFGGQFKADAARNPFLAAELGKAKAGVIMGWIGIGISILLTVCLFAFGAASSVMSGMHR